MVVTYKLYSNYKAKLYNIYTQNKGTPNITLKIVIKSQSKRTREEEKEREDLQKQSENNKQNGNKYMKENESVSHLVMSESLLPHGL